MRRRRASLLKSLTREYTLDEIAILTRAGPARSLGLKDRGHLGVGASRRHHRLRTIQDREAMFATPEYRVQERRADRQERQGGEGGAGRDPCGAARLRQVDREAAQGLFRPLPHRAHGEFQARRRGDHPRRQRRRSSCSRPARACPSVPHASRRGLAAAPQHEGPHPEEARSAVSKGE